MITRRSFAKLGIAATASLGTSHGQAVRTGKELQSSELALPSEELIYDEDKFSFIYNQALGKPKNRKAFCERMVEIANGFADAGVSRSSNPAQVKRFLELLGFDLKYPNGKYVPYCACGVSYVAAQAICDIDPKEPYDPKNPIPKFREALTTVKQFYFLPHPAVRKIKEKADGGSWVAKEKASPKKGWLVIFDWNGDGVPDHIGLVDHLDGKTLHTVEFNTVRTGPGDERDGGAVARRQRDLGPVMGYVGLY